MKGLRKYLTPFAPDQSGAVSVLYELGGIIVICDAGGCSGNVCGFDEPRWAYTKSAIFSAGLRDMDAIMGSDDKLAAKITDAASKIDANFIALIGTPVPAVIGTDFRAIKRMINRKIDIPVLTIDTNGMELYDKGEEKAYLALFDEFAKETFEPVPGRIGVIGATPSELSLTSPPEDGLYYYGFGSGLDSVREASKAEYNLVVAPSGIKAAMLLKERFGTPYKTGFPNASNITDTLLKGTDVSGKNTLILHQHVLAASLKSELIRRGAANVTLAGFFMPAEEIRTENDVFIKEEDEFESLINNGDFQIIMADAALKPLAKGFSGIWIDLPHFALSGRLMEQ